ncbi:phenazine-specific anthranilate synthase component I [Flexivirga sp. ID2601S]|uniref:anthranilate synthase n=1 Tax=Flexivirga aerilata TaxID=1656889 RepID=A0A849AHR9_9MICO|nr:anthranilate synthase family protein [Flexivirga aerilata]NNG39407.1 phenazine-specific anthranilate synthase component I [Flexivirga aerilata]
MSLLQQILKSPPPAFAIIARGEDKKVSVHVGDVAYPRTIDELPDGDMGPTIAVVPFRQVSERGFTCEDDGTPLLAIRSFSHEHISLSEALEDLPDVDTELVGGAFDQSDDEYADMVNTVKQDVISAGDGANFVLARQYEARLARPDANAAPSVLRRLLANEVSAHWTFLVHAGGRTLVGASPELHVSLRGGIAAMTPISGTYRYPVTGPSELGVLRFLRDQKETSELFMVVDEELKMMAEICSESPTVTGPFLRTMARLAHTEYRIEGRCDKDPRVVLRETLLAPTVTGAPLENACRVIARHEPSPRGYYSGVAAWIDSDDDGTAALDSAILIRTCEIDSEGGVRLGVGATLVSGSDPRTEVAETHTKVATLLASFTRTAEVPDLHTESVQRALAQRNSHLSQFWAGARPTRPMQRRCRGLLVDAEDSFTAMLEAQLDAIGIEVRTLRVNEVHGLDHDSDLLILGPGPGDPTDLSLPKNQVLGFLADRALSAKQPMLAICLSHQILSARMGVSVRRKETPNQGVQQEIDLFGARERVGFYNSFAAVLAGDQPPPADLEIACDPATGEVHAMRAAGLSSMQFHPESVLTMNGPDLLAREIDHVLATSPVRAEAD